MAIDLLTLEPQKISRNLRGKFAFFYGAPGAGKTSLAAQFPKSLICSFEQGSNALNNVYVAPIKTWSDWKSIGAQLCRKNELKDKFETICIDTADEAWELCVKYVCSNNGIERLGDLPYGQGYDIAKKEFASLLRDLSFAGYGLIFISHSMEKTVSDENDEDIVQILPALPARPYAVVNKMVDIVGYIREVKNEEGERVRRIFFRGNEHFFAKSRFRYIEPVVDFSYENIVNALYDAIDKEVAASGGEASNEENPYTQLDFNALMEEAKLLWVQVVQEEKVIEANKLLEEEFGKPTKFSEITAEQIEQLNNVIMKIRDLI